MPTDTTIIERLRAEAEWFGSRKWGDTGLRQHGEAAAAAMRDAADALTAAHAARDAAEQIAEARRVALVAAGDELERQIVTHGVRLEAMDRALTTALRERDEARAMFEEAISAARCIAYPNIPDLLVGPEWYLGADAVLGALYEIKSKARNS